MLRRRTTVLKQIATARERQKQKPFICILKI